MIDSDVINKFSDPEVVERINKLRQMVLDETKVQMWNGERIDYLEREVAELKTEKEKLLNELNQLKSKSI